ncbi:circularly permuted type 2 ATP-grasp protein, partial [Rubellimicrobium rubrum]
MGICWDDYPTDSAFDELIQSPGRPRPGAEALCAYLASLDEQELTDRVATAEKVIRLMGISFRVYGEDGGSIDRHWPYDL